MVWYGEEVWPTYICDWSESLQKRFGRQRRGMGLGFVGANMGLGFGWWRRALGVGSVLDDEECFGRRWRFDREACIGWQRSGMGKEKGNERNRKSEFSFLYYWVLCIIGFFFFKKIMLTWKIVGILKVSVICIYRLARSARITAFRYIYIYII